MILASEDPINIILVIVWVLGLLFCQLLAVYAYIRWKTNPNDAISHRIAVAIRGMSIPMAMFIALWIGVGLGIVIGMFAGHWFWPVELTQ